MTFLHPIASGLFSTTTTPLPLAAGGGIDWPHELGQFIFLGVVGVIAVVGAMIDRRRKRARRRTAVAAASKQALRPVEVTHPTILPRKISPPDPDAPARVISPIQSIRDLLGQPPREFDPAIQDYLHLAPPTWLVKRPDDEMNLPYRNQGMIRRLGPVVWACVVQANKNIFKPGPHDHGASMIYSADPWFDDHPGNLLPIARELFSLKNTDQADPESAAFARMLTIELARAPRLRVPSRFTGGRAIFHSSMMLVRKHLPKGLLSGNLMPVWLDPDDTGMLILVPAAYWPPSLLVAWDPSVSSPSAYEPA